jgi:hypothetical protein
MADLKEPELLIKPYLHQKAFISLATSHCILQNSYLGGFIGRNEKNRSKCLFQNIDFNI